MPGAGSKAARAATIRMSRQTLCGRVYRKLVGCLVGVGMSKRKAPVVNVTINNYFSKAPRTETPTAPTVQAGKQQRTRPPFRTLVTEQRCQLPMQLFRKSTILFQMELCNHPCIL